MDYQRKCPNCGRRHIYYSHECGQVIPCPRCGQPMELFVDALRLMRLLVWALIVCMPIACCGFGSVVWKAQGQGKLMQPQRR